MTFLTTFLFTALLGAVTNSAPADNFNSEMTVKLSVSGSDYVYQYEFRYGRGNAGNFSALVMSYDTNLVSPAAVPFPCKASRNVAWQTLTASSGGYDYFFMIPQGSMILRGLAQDGTLDVQENGFGLRAGGKLKLTVKSRVSTSVPGIVVYYGYRNTGGAVFYPKAFYTVGPVTLPPDPAEFLDLIIGTTEKSYGLDWLSGTLLHNELVNCLNNAKGLIEQGSGFYDAARKYLVAFYGLLAGADYSAQRTYYNPAFYPYGRDRDYYVPAAQPAPQYLAPNAQHGGDSHNATTDHHSQNAVHSGGTTTTLPHAHSGTQTTLAPSHNATLHHQSGYRHSRGTVHGPHPLQPVYGCSYPDGVTASYPSGRIDDACRVMLICEVEELIAELDADTAVPPLNGN